MESNFATTAAIPVLTCSESPVLVLRAACMCICHPSSHAQTLPSLKSQASSHPRRLTLDALTDTDDCGLPSCSITIIRGS